MPTKAECLIALDNIYCFGYEYEIEILRDLIDEHFDNPALHLDELKPGMWVYDTSIHKYRLILYIEENKIYFAGQKLSVKFKDNKFYRFLVE